MRLTQTITVKNFGFTTSTKNANCILFIFYVMKNQNLKAICLKHNNMHKDSDRRKQGKD